MPIVAGAPGLLVKARGRLDGARLRLGAAQVAFEAQPLFQSIGRGPEHALAGPSTWYVVVPSVALDDQNPWDLCHQLLGGGLGTTGAGVEFVEPDFQQRWLPGREPDLALAMADACTGGEEQDRDYPRGDGPLWFRDAGHGQFESALAALGNPDAGSVRIAHLDTGYDPSHQTVPRHLETRLARNFVDAEDPNDATDDSEGLFNSLGHGTGTLGILAGTATQADGTIGAAPFAKVVPMRVANGVVLFKSSAIARAFDYVHDLCGQDETRVDVVTMSLGGVPCQAWADAVNALYEAGVFVVTAAGNNFGNLPTRNIVFPARFRRVVAACGVMANHEPYADLGGVKMAGNYGPQSKMDTAIAAYTPNTPWAVLGCKGTVRRNGGGTSSATPQVAAAAAIWIQQNRGNLDGFPRNWTRVEAVRKALFDSARKTDEEHLGHGALRARDALDHQPADSDRLSPQKPDEVSFPVLRTLFGVAAEAPDARQRMLELEALQLWQSATLEQVLPDPTVDPATLSQARLREIADALHDHGSKVLKDRLEASTRGRVYPAASIAHLPGSVEREQLKAAMAPEMPAPTRRRLRVYAYDPSLGTQLDTLGINEAALDVPWEQLQPGPTGEYLEVIDVDPVSRRCYAPVELDAPRLLAQNGLPPSEGNPQFQQQMAYAVAMRTIEHFERALGRVALWAPHSVEGKDRSRRDTFVRRLRVYPHALRTENAFYSPEKKALLLGYFEASKTGSPDVLPGGLVFTALSHDIIAHETTHALLDGLHRRFREPTNPDVLAFHEAFADIVALFQHFTMPEALRHQIAQTRGDLGRENLLGKLAVQFGKATGRHRALRDAIGDVIDGKDGKEWKPAEPSPDDYDRATESHARGAVLVAAVFDAFRQIYESRTRDLVRLATSGSGVLPPGAIPADLIERLAVEASKTAGHVLNICIRALDYCPPIDITFGEYLRALITADRDLVPDDRRDYRVAFVSAFRARGIYAPDVKTLSVDSLSWEPPPIPLKNVRNILRQMSLNWDLTVEREQAYNHARDNARKMHAWLMDGRQVSEDEIAVLGLDRVNRPARRRLGVTPGELRRFEVHSVRPARRVGPDGQLRSDLVVEITQTFRPDHPEGARFRGGCTLLIDLDTSEVRYCIRKRVTNEDRLAKQLKLAELAADGLAETYFARPDDLMEPFALLHRPRE